MSNCCTNTRDSKQQHKKYQCPVNGKIYKQVNTQTILHHLQVPWLWQEKQQAYYFCEDPDCDVVYFGQDDSVIYKKALRTKVGIKEKTHTSLLCYCFGVSFAESVKNPKIKQYIIEKTKNNMCACNVQNPSGKCCLKDFPKHHA